MVTKKKSRLITCAIFLVAWLAVIWGNSMTTGEVSGQFSGWASALLGKILPFLSPDAENGHLLVRKLAHFSEFAVLGLLFGWLFSMLTEKKLHRFLFALSCGMVAAVIDEFIQFFTPDRVCSFWDMCIDWSGVLTGLSFLTILLLLLQKRKNKVCD